MERHDALQLVEELVQNPRLKVHLLAVEAAMRSYAARSGADPELFGNTGLLHDADWEQFPDEHPLVIIGKLRALGEEEMAVAINGHGGKGAIPRTSDLAKALFACDELCGFITAYSYMQPDGIAGLTPGKISKKLKDKSFAATVNRDDIQHGADELGLPFEMHIQQVLEAMTAVAIELGLVKTS